MTASGVESIVSGRYALGATIGRGGMAEVREAQDLVLDRPVAMKLLRPGVAVDRSARARFEAEARSAARLSHPNVVSVFDTGVWQGVPFIVMERLPGRTLADRIGEGPMPEAEVRRVAAEVCSALAAAHAAGIVHRDVKPGNILFGTRGEAKVADFGIAKSMDGAGRGDLTATNLVIGSPPYLAPERVDGKPATPSSDIWSLGVVLYEALTHSKPFSGETPIATALAILGGERVPLRDLRDDVSPHLERVVDTAMAPLPEDRYSSAGAMADALAKPDAPATLDGWATIPPAVDPVLTVPVSAGPNLSEPNLTEVLPIARRPKRGMLVGAAALAVALVLVAVLAAGGVFAGSKSKTLQPPTSATTQAPPSTTVPAVAKTPPSTTPRPPPKHGDHHHAAAQPPDPGDQGG